MKALKIEKGELHISRSSPLHSRPLALKRVVQYTPNWVKNQQRMASTSNQETFRADVDGRLVIDLLRHVSSMTILNGSLLSLFPQGSLFCHLTVKLNYISINLIRGTIIQPAKSAACIDLECHM